VYSRCLLQTTAKTRVGSKTDFTSLPFPSSCFSSILIHAFPIPAFSILLPHPTAPRLFPLPCLLCPLSPPSSAICWALQRIHTSTISSHHALFYLYTISPCTSSTSISTSTAHKLTQPLQNHSNQKSSPVSRTQRPTVGTLPITSDMTSSSPHHHYKQSRFGRL